MYIRDRILQRVSRPEARSPTYPARPRPTPAERAPVVSFHRRFRSRASRCCIRWPPSRSAGTDLCVGPGHSGDRPCRQIRRRSKTPAGRPSVSPPRRALPATPPTACLSCRERSDNSSPGPPPLLCAKVCAHNLCFARRVPEIAVFAMSSVRETYVSACIRLSPHVQMVEVE
jgi:hypothetical protein